MIDLNLAQYRIDAEIGRGGMGVVYRATDTKLNRTVALKVLPAAALSSEEDRARFFREAQSAAQLSHPNVCHVYQVDEAIPHRDGEEPVLGSEKRPFIAMEFIEGDTLAERISKAPLKLAESVNIASQVAEALKAAHAKQIVHRDIKSANVMLTADGVAKVLDFGLAKTNQSTMLTRQGSTLGTVAYMSPEQARGQEVDGRSDLYSLGTMLYEMVAGRLPFAGDYEQAVVYGILNEPPEPLTSLRTGVPMQLEWIVNKLLSKEADYRYQTAADLLADLKSLDLTGSGHSRRSMASVSGAVGAAVQGTPLTREGRGGIPGWIWGMVAGIAFVAAAVGWVTGGGLREEPPEPVRRLQSNFDPAANPQIRISVSADGRALASISMEEDGVHAVVRFLDEPNARILPITNAGTPMALSPEARWIAYHKGGSLMRVSTSGGTPEIIAELDGGFVGWLSENEVISNGGRKLWRVRGTDDPIEIPVEVHDEATPAQPFPIPGTSVVFYTALASSMAASSIHAVDIESGKTVEIATRATWPRYHPSGYVLFYRGEDIHAARFDPGTFELGPSFVVQTSIASVGDGLIAAYDVSQTDLMVYQTGGAGLNDGRKLVQHKAGGEPADSGIETKDYWDPRYSPDGRRVLSHALSQDGDTEVWLLDLTRSTARRMTSSPGEDETAIWSPDGTRFYYSSDADGVEYLLRRSVDGSSPIDTLFSSTDHLHVESISTDERYVVISLRDTNRGFNLWSVDLDGDGTAVPLLDGPADEAAGKVSPDGRFLAYQSDETGRNEIYVSRFPDVVGIQRVSSQGGETPVWSRDGRSLYYVQEDRIMRLDFTAGEPGSPEIFIALAPGAFVANPHTTFDVLGDTVIYARSELDQARVRAEIVSGLGTLLKSLDTQPSSR